MKKHCIDFPQTTTIEHLYDLIRPCYGASLQYHGMVLATTVNWRGQYEAATYEFIETEEETGLGDIECRLNLTEVANETFTDSGNAIEWAMKAVTK